MRNPLLLQPLLALAACFAIALACPVTLPAQDADDDKKVTPYSHKSSKGTTYYLFSREQKLKNSDKTVTMYFFAKDPNNKKGTPLAKVPEDRVVSETKTGLLVLKKKDKS